MNKAITEGVLLMPPAFADGLNVWSSGDGTPGTDTYQNAVNTDFAPADQDLVVLRSCKNFRVQRAFAIWARHRCCRAATCG